jgi:hypothetical protein
MKHMDMPSKAKEEKKSRKSIKRTYHATGKRLSNALSSDASESEIRRHAGLLKGPIVRRAEAPVKNEKIRFIPLAYRAYWSYVAGVKYVFRRTAMTKKNPADPRCASCPIVNRADRRCSREDGKAPPNCPTALKSEMIAESRKVYTEGEFTKFARVASQVERVGYEAAPGGGLKPTRPRIVEIVDFAQRMGYKKLGLIVPLWEG